ncbi:conserved hypothetical protein [Desulfamplus magnetovallimortis]|uniref:CoA-binding domain-containing protein n=1 Tax=Desulfamplus magnetovallimortis TaxID=1246637 RepID=A0A1W1HJ56_9BACT|nr:acetate--CoA ligase family protein [Desulfamplus magnetovallimortis]SLM32398.1 conserved hypothetical protein [Desulfamplus magnetovallimortis]
MKLYVKTEEICGLFKKAADEGRSFLYEYEVYELISLIGGETPLTYRFLEKDGRLNDTMLADIPGDKVVLKVVSPNILHKSDIGGVRIVDKTRSEVLSAVRSMMYEVPEKYCLMLEKKMGGNITYNEPLQGGSSGLTQASSNMPYRELDREASVEEIKRDIKGILICEFLPIDNTDFGNELLVSLRRTREFGMILTAGLGGTDTELYARRFRTGQAVVSASTEMMDAEAFFDLYKRTISFDKLTGIGRGEKRKVTDEQLKECFAALILIANYFSPLNSSAPFVIEELEINPFAFFKYLMVPLDGLCSFSHPTALPPPRPISKIDFLLHPKSIAIMGVSTKSRNPGHIILENILANGFNRSDIFIIHPSAEKNLKAHRIFQQDHNVASEDNSLSLELNDLYFVPSVKHLPGKVDLLILAVSAQAVQSVLDDVIENDIAKSLIIIPGGLGEVIGSEGARLAIENKIQKLRAFNTEDSISFPKDDFPGGPVFLGGNSLGVLSHPGKYDSLFIPEDKLPKCRGDHPRSSAFISQSGAYMITRMSKMSFLDPAYALSIGNQMDLTAGDLLHYFNKLDNITTVAIYMEGFRDLDGLEFARAVRDAVRKGKEILFYKAGRTPEGKHATSGHTASLAGDYAVCKSCIREAGAMVADTFTEFEGLVQLSWALHNKNICGNGLAAISNAGYESVGIADNILGDDFQLQMALFSELTRSDIKMTLENSGLASLVDIKNPMDVTPMAVESVYEEIIEAFLKDSNVHAVIAAIVPLTPVMETLPGQLSSENRHNEDVKNDNRNNENVKNENLPNGNAKNDNAENICGSENIKKRNKNIIKSISELASHHSKPVIMVIDSGELYDPLAKAFQAEGLPVFRSADQAVYVLGKYIRGRLGRIYRR